MYIATIFFTTAIIASFRRSRNFPCAVSPTRRRLYHPPVFAHNSKPQERDSGRCRSQNCNFSVAFLIRSHRVSWSGMTTVSSRQKSREWLKCTRCASS